MSEGCRDKWVGRQSRLKLSFDHIPEWQRRILIISILSDKRSLLWPVLGKKLRASDDPTGSSVDGVAAPDAINSFRPDCLSDLGRVYHAPDGDCWT
jgi:hypothetical protein